MEADIRGQRPEGRPDRSPLQAVENVCRRPGGANLLFTILPFYPLSSPLVRSFRYFAISLFRDFINGNIVPIGLLLPEY